MKLLQLAGDWWWPKLSADGRYVAGGGATANPKVRLLDLGRAPRAQSDLGNGRSVHWLNENTLTWISEDGLMRDVRWICKPGGVPQRTADDPSLVAANDFAAANGHWASWLANGLRLVYDGKIIMIGVRGVAMNGNFMLTRTDSAFVLFLAGVEVRRFPLPPRANSWTLSPTGIIGYGYYWPAHVLFFHDGANRDLDITVAAWGQEGVPVVVPGPAGSVWAWTHTVRPGDQRSLVLGRPVASGIAPGVTPCIVIEDFPANTLDVVFVDGGFVLAGTNTDGTLYVHQIFPDEVSMTPVLDIVAVPTPVPTPTPVPQPVPEPPMADYKNLVAEERANYGTPLGIENAWRICNAVALRLRQMTGDQRWGLHRKAGNNFDGYAVDIVAYNGGFMFDVLGDSEGAGTPQWNQSDPTTDWAPPVGDVPQPGPDPDPTPTPSPVDIGGALALLVDRVGHIDRNVETIIAAMGAVNDTISAKGDALVKAINDKQIRIGL
jgi:hypothetical protein